MEWPEGLADDLPERRDDEPASMRDDIVDAIRSARDDAEVRAEATAAVMNRLFVNIKVDREERPDLDKVYQSAHQLLAQRAGGWPLTMFLMPGDLRPFFAGTYFPRESRHGLPAFTYLLEQVERAYREQRLQREREERGEADPSA